MSSSGMSTDSIHTSIDPDSCRNATFGKVRVKSLEFRSHPHSGRNAPVVVRRQQLDCRTEVVGHH
jgi:hypothetical protein